jgi:hypothetical protein
LLGFGRVRNLWKPTFSKENPFFIASGSLRTGVKKNEENDGSFGQHHEWDELLASIY